MGRLGWPPWLTHGATSRSISLRRSARSVRITHVFETHVHNDYVTGALELTRPCRRDHRDRRRRRACSYEHLGVREGDSVTVGRHALRHRWRRPATRPPTSASRCMPLRQRAPRRLHWRQHARRATPGRTDLVSPGMTLDPNPRPVSLPAPPARQPASERAASIRPTALAPSVARPASQATPATRRLRMSGQISPACAGAGRSGIRSPADGGLRSLSVVLRLHARHQHLRSEHPAWRARDSRLNAPADERPDARWHPPAG